MAINTMIHVNLNMSDTYFLLLLVPHPIEGRNGTRNRKLYLLLTPTLDPLILILLPRYVIPYLIIDLLGGIKGNKEI